jgi:Tfp pilus assembly protein PilX
MTMIEPTSTSHTGNRDNERGAALIMALLVSVILVFLGMGLLLQTSLGLQAAGTDRWVAKAMYAADAGVMMQIQMIQNGAIGSAGSFVFQDDPALDGFLKGEYTVTISEFCETRPMTTVWDDDTAWSSEFKVRHFHLRSDALRTIGGLGGLSRAAVAADVSAWPFVEDQLVPVTQCRGAEWGS